MGGGMLRAGIGPGVFSTVKPKPTGFLPVPSSPSSSSPSVSLPVSATSSVARWRSTSRFVDEDDWDYIQEEDGNVVTVFPQRHVFGPVPSKEEVESAISTLQQAVFPVAYSHVVDNRFAYTPKKDAADQMTNATDFTRCASSTKSELDWNETALHLYNPKAAQSQGYDYVLDAFRLLQTNPTVQRMVFSLSSDKAIWDAVMNNESVRELKESFYAAENNQLESSEEGPQVAVQLLRWILDYAKAKIAEIIDNITKLINDLFRPAEKERAMDIFEDTLRSSLMLSIMVLLVVVVTRVQRA